LSPTLVRRQQNPTTAMMNSKSDEFLTVRQVASRLGVSERHVRRLISRAQPPRERLPSYRIGRLVRIRGSDLEEFLNRRSR
jgi:excisionase family DNA binding protein